MNRQNKRLLILLICAIIICISLGTAISLGLKPDTPLQETSKKVEKQQEAKKENIKKSNIDVMFSYDYQNLSLTEILKQYCNEHKLNASNFSYAYLNLETMETSSFNANTQMFAASTYKLPLNMYWYELQNAGKYNKDSLLHYHAYCNEDSSGYIYQNYPINSVIPLATLQYYSIVESDNVASQILFAGLGGWNAMMEAIHKYSPNTHVYTNENYFNAAYMLDTLKYLYQNQEVFQELLTNMKTAKPNSYFKKYVDDVDIAHKYGEYDIVHNDVGIIFTKQPYALAVFTNNIDGENIVGEVNRIIYEYHKAHE